MEFVIVTGMSGAGKSYALKFLEDLDFFCVDNLPPVLLPKFAEICLKQNSEVSNAAFGIDIRSGKHFDELLNVLESMSDENYNFSILFLDATDEVLLKRYKETRRSHPLAKNDRIIVGIEKEREMLAKVRENANHIINTSNVLTRQLRESLEKIYVNHEKFSSLMINVLSFGFKYGIPTDCDLVFDVRFIPNPFYTELKEFTGLDKSVQDYVMQFEASKDFLGKLIDMVNFLLPNYVSEGKNQLVIGIGCTGGKHRSVTLAGELYKSLKNDSQSVIINHRDIDKDGKK